MLIILNKIFKFIIYLFAFLFFKIFEKQHENFQNVTQANLPNKIKQCIVT